jgi:hypothetical protein
LAEPLAEKYAKKEEKKRNRKLDSPSIVNLPEY